MAVAVAVRLIGIGLEPLTFHGARQLYDALMARGFWLDLGGQVPAGTEGAVRAASSAVIEPPVVQGLAAALYAVVGGEQVAVVRAVTALLWVAVAPAVWDLNRRLSGRVAAVAGTVVWLFLPFAVAASRSFQPDGPMVCFIVLALWVMVHDDDGPDSRSGWIALAFGALAIFLKLTAAAAILPAMVALQWSRSGPRSLVGRSFLARCLVVVAPAVLYWAVGAALGALSGQGEGRVAPAELLDLSFWTGWWAMLGRVIGALGIVLVAMALVVATRRPTALLVGLVAGYLVQALVFVHHTPTHDYYHLLAIVPFVVAVGSVAGALDGVIRRRTERVASRVGAVALLCASVLLLVARPYPYLETALPNRLATMVAAAREAGPALGHSDRVLFVSRAYGAVQQYDGYLAGPAWPLQGDLDAEARFGVPNRSAEERFAAMEEAQPLEWVLVTEPAVLEEQPDLARLLRSRFELSVQGDGWTAYRRR